MSPGRGGVPGGGIPGRGIPGGGIPGGGIPGQGYYGDRPKRKVWVRGLRKNDRPDEGTSEHPDDNDKPGGMRGELPDYWRRHRRRRSISEISQSLVQLRDYQGSLRIAEIQASREKSEQYQRTALRVASKSLDAVHNALTMELPGSRRLRSDEVLATIIALQDNVWWDELLKSHQLTDEEAAKAAAHGLAECIASLEADEISSGSLLRLLADVDILRKEIDFASRQAVLLSPGAVRQYISAAYSIAGQITVGLIAVSATTGAAGAKVVPEVIYSAIGFTAASSVAEIYRRTSRGLKARTVLSQLQQYHYELVEAVGDLANFMPWLSGSDPPSDDALDTVKSTCLAAGFLVSHVEQLTLSFTWPERGVYCDLLHAIRGLLDEVHDLIAEQRYQDAQEVQDKLVDANRRLHEFSSCIDGLGSHRI
jgi:hypothetical protein